MKEEQVLEKVTNYLKTRGCPITRKEFKIKDRVIDMVGYTINKDGELHPEVVVEVTKNTKSKSRKQNMVNSNAQHMNTDYALLVLYNEEEIERYIWYKDFLPAYEEPQFESFYDYIVKKEDIIKIMYSANNSLRKMYSPTQSSIIFLQHFLIRKYLNDKKLLDKWLELSIENMKEYYQMAHKYYELPTNKRFIELKEQIFRELLYIIKDLSPVSEAYLDIFLEINEKDIKIHGHSTTRNFVDIYTSVIKTLNITNGNIIDITSGLGFTLLKVAKESNFQKTVGIEISPDAYWQSRVLTIISGQEDVEIINHDSLIYKSDTTYNLTMSEPPINLVGEPDNIDYQDYELLKETKRKRVNYTGLFIEKAINITEDNGYIVTVVSEGVLFTRKNKKLRDLILKKTIIKGIIRMPSTTMRPYTSVRLNILILQKKSKSDPTPENFFVGDIENMEQIDMIIGQFNNWIRKEE